MIYAEVTALADRYKVDIHPEDMFLESLNFDSIESELTGLGYAVKEQIQISDDTWHLILTEHEQPEKAYKGYGLVVTYYKVLEVVSVLESGRSKDGKHILPIPGSKLATKSRQVGNFIIYQDKDYHAIWSSKKQDLDVLRKRVIEWRRNHAFRIERFI